MAHSPPLGGGLSIHNLANKYSRKRDCRVITLRFAAIDYRLRSVPVSLKVKMKIAHSPPLGGGLSIPCLTNLACQIQTDITPAREIYIPPPSYNINLS